MNKKYIYFLFALVILLWGINWTVSKLILQSITPIWTAALRAVIATGTLFTVQVLSKQFIIPKKHDMPIIWVIGVFHLTLFTLFMSLGLELIPVGRSVVLAYTTPLWVVPSAILFLHEPVSKVKICGVLLGIIGVLILIDPFTFAQQNASQITGNLFLILSSISWAISIIYTKSYTWRSSPFQLISWQMLLASVLLVCASLFFEGLPKITFTPSLLSQLAYTGFLASAIGFWAMTEITKKLPAVEVSLGSLLTPVVGIFISQKFLGEKLDLPLIIGTMFILGGVFMAYMKSSSAK